MRYYPETMDFRGTMSLLLEGVGNNTERRLDVPIEIVVATEADSAIPNQLNLDHTYLPPQEVRVVTTNPQQTVQVRFVTATNPIGFEAAIPVEPTITIEFGRENLQGFGIEKTTLVVTRRPLGSEPPPEFHVTGSQGYVEPEKMDLSSGQASVSVRSSGLGEAIVRVTATGYRTAQARLEYVVPWFFFIAALFGSGIGALIKVLRTAKPTSKQYVWRLLWGVVVALVWTAVGLNLLNVGLPPYYNEGLVFVLGALGSLTGPVKQKE